MIRHNDTFKIAEGLYAQFIQPPGDQNGRLGWRIMDRFGRGLLIPEEAVENVCALFEQTKYGIDARKDFEMTEVDGCDVGTVTGIEPTA